jgi:hypothetical protein
MLGLYLRVFTFVTTPLIRENFIRMNDSLQIFLIMLSSTFFLCAYLGMIFFWAELVHHEKLYKRRILRWVFLILCIMINFIIVFMFVLDVIFSYFMSDGGNSDTEVATALTPMQKLATIFIAVAYVVVCSGFLLYGMLLLIIMRRMVYRADVQKFLSKVGMVSIMCSFCFLIRSTFILIVDLVIVSWNASPIFFLIFWLALEAAPVELMLFVLGKLGSGRSSSSSVSISGAKNTENAGSYSRLESNVVDAPSENDTLVSRSQKS